MMEPRRAALIIANDEYEDPKLRRLRAPSYDAQALARVLADAAIGGFEANVLLNEPEHRLRRQLAAFFANRSHDDLLLVHFSCHGVKDDDGALYFATSDTEVDHLDATAIPSEFVNRHMSRSRSRRIALFLDCCYSGAFSRGARARAGEGVDLAERFDGRGQVVITASNAMEYAFEGEELTGEGQPSVFTRALVEGLETGAADLDGDSLVSIEELYDYVYERVREATPNQTPSKWMYDLQGELYIARNPNPPSIEPAELPPELDQAIESPFAAIRLGAVQELARLLRATEQRIRLAAQNALEALAEDDSRSVSEAATAALAETPTTPTETIPAGQAEPELGEPAARPPEQASEPLTSTPPTPPRTPAKPAAVSAPASTREPGAVGSGRPFVIAASAATAGVALTLIAAMLSWVTLYRSFGLLVIVAALLVLACIPGLRSERWRELAVGALLALGAEHVAGAVTAAGFEWRTAVENRSGLTVPLTLVGAFLILAAGAVSWFDLRRHIARQDETHTQPSPGRLLLGLAAAACAFLVAALFVPFNESGVSIIDLDDDHAKWGALEPIAGIAGIVGAVFIAYRAPRLRRLARGALLGFGTYCLLLFLAYAAFANSFSDDSPGKGVLLGVIGSCLALAAAFLFRREPRTTG